MTKTNKLKRLTLFGALMAVMLMAALPAGAANYVFVYNNGYLAVGDNGAIIYTTTLSPQCVWTCVSSATNLTASTLSGTSTYLYTTDANGTRLWLIGSTTDGAGITTSTTAGTARWRVDGNSLFWRNSNNYYAYYRDNTWRTSRRNNGTTYGVAAYMSGNNSGTDYRSTTYEVTVSTVTSTSSGPTINGADVLTATGNSTYTATGAAYRIGYTNYYFNSANHYVDADGNSFTGTPANATITNTWSLTDNAYATVNSTSGVVTVSSLPEYDIHLTLTVTATATGGNPEAPANTTFTASKVITIQGTKPSAPTITISGSSVTITTDAPGTTTIRYTTNGNDPTATTGTVYNGTIDLTSSATSPVTIKAVTVRNGNASDVTEQTVTLTLPEPTLTINGEAQTATIAAATGATIYYTTDGSTPTTSSSQYTGTLTGLAYMTTVKAIAVKDGWNDSPVASGIVTIPSGVSGGVVTLFDYEPHSWSYYSDPDCPIRSLNPADVKITYFGNGTGTISTTNGVTPGNNSWAANATTVAVSYNETENTFVYYKTLERTDGSSSANPTGRCEYTAIPNPFSVRPTYTYANGTNNNYCGFYKWRVKTLSGGAIYTAATGGSSIAVGGTIDADQTVYFAPTAEYGMTVELEALWARAYVTTGSTSMTTYVTGTNAYERNFHVVTNTGQTASNYQKGYPVTISSRYPNGTSGGGSFNAGGFTAAADTKIEYLNIGTANNNTWTGAGYNFVIGRGVSGTVNVVRGINGNVTSPNYTLRIESGTYNFVSILRGYSNTSGTSTDGGSSLGGTPTVRSIFGCDYDRANNENGITDNLRIVNNLYYASSVTENNLTYSENAVKAYIKSGRINSGVTISNNHTASAQYTAYMGSAANRLRGHRKLFMEGGEVASIAGGIDGEQNENNNSFTLRMTGGHVRGSIYGGGARSAGYGNRRMVITGGSITGWVGGGCNGEAYPNNSTDEDLYGGITRGAARVYFGGTAVCGGTGSNIIINGSAGGNVFGAGKGVEGNTTSGRMSQGTTVVIADECSIDRNVYGGGNFGYAQTSTDVYVAGGNVQGDIFGGSNQNNGPDIDIVMKAGKIGGGLYGGCNTSGSISGHINIDVYGTDPQEGNTYAVGAVYGGGNQANYSGTPNVNVHCGDNISIEYVYGGGNAATVTGTNVTIEGGNKIGNVFGGCYGANVTTNGTKVNIKGGTIGKVFGGNNQSGTIGGTIKVRVHKDGSCPMKIGELYGGGNMAASAAGTITIGCTGDSTAAHASSNSTDNRIGYELEGIGDVYGGANAADITSGNIAITIDSGMVNRVFGGNNTSGTISGTITVTINKTANSCGWYCGEVYGGGNQAAYSGTPDVNINAGIVERNVFGGGNNIASGGVAGGDVAMTGGLVKGNLFGGCNVSGTVSGTTSVKMSAGTVGVSGSKAEGCVYGGGLGSGTDVTGKATVEISGSAKVINDVFGGGSQGTVGSTQVTIKD